MATTKTQYDTVANITITLASITTGSARESASQDNSSNQYLDALVALTIKLATGGTIGADKKIYVYAAGSIDGGTVWPDNVTGSDAAITLLSPTELKLIGVIEAGAYVSPGTITFKSEPFSVAQAFGGILPQRWSIIVLNSTNITFDATEGSFTKKLQGIWAQTI
jgi:hypothetical protein